MPLGRRKKHIWSGKSGAIKAQAQVQLLTRMHPSVKIYHLSSILVIGTDKQMVVETRHPAGPTARLALFVSDQIHSDLGWFRFFGLLPEPYQSHQKVVRLP
ncbi:unnamed protein product [Protopolystoma xenopodis]|uniref:Uncharacterized protein n=1 Tax=Protopolystoma xenopodis TaxID=117903 RepID=A0A3S5CQK3_9PLAT|nr:unnamed protein product [Protopolystoma xenopodis]